MSTSQWIQLLVPLISIIAAIISAGLSYIFAKNLQIRADERNLKKIYYQNYISAISKVAINNSSEYAKDELANAHNKLILIGSSEVVTLAMDFHDLIRSGNRANFSIEKHNEILTELVKAMRKDLYTNRKTNSHYPLIHLCGSNK